MVEVVLLDDSGTRHHSQVANNMVTIATRYSKNADMEKVIQKKSKSELLAMVQEVCQKEGWSRDQFCENAGIKKQHGKDWARRQALNYEDAVAIENIYAEKIGERIHSKLHTARRQLDSAIELWFNEGDKISIHTLASAAYKVIREDATEFGPEMTEGLIISSLIGLQKNKIVLNEVESLFVTWLSMENSRLFKGNAGIMRDKLIPVDKEEKIGTRKDAFFKFILGSAIAADI